MRHMNWQLLVPLLVTSFLTISGWYILHNFAKQRDMENKQKELRINYLIEAWRNLEHAANRNSFDPSETVEKSIADIQLFGTSKQIELAQKFTSDLVETKKGNIDELLEELRQDLRNE